MAFASPYMRKHELTFKPAFEFVNANVAQDKAPVLMCSAFIESDYEPMPAPTSENAFFLNRVVASSTPRRFCFRSI